MMRMKTVALLPLLAAMATALAGPAATAADGGGSGLSVDLKRAASGWDVSLSGAGGAGGAMLTVDKGKPVAISGASYHLDALPAGNHQLDFAVAGPSAAGQPIAERILLQIGKNKPAANAPAEPKPIGLAIAKDKVTATGASINSGTFRITQGDFVRFDWTTDAAMQIHLHGYDIEADLAPQTPVAMIFDASLPGRFSIEKHGAKEVNLVYLEVYPK